MQTSIFAGIPPVSEKDSSVSTTPVIKTALDVEIVPVAKAGLPVVVTQKFQQMSVSVDKISADEVNKLVNSFPVSFLDTNIDSHILNFGLALEEELKNYYNSVLQRMQPKSIAQVRAVINELRTNNQSTNERLDQVEREAGDYYEAPWWIKLIGVFAKDSARNMIEKRKARGDEIFTNAFKDERQKIVAFTTSIDKRFKTETDGLVQDLRVNKDMLENHEKFVLKYMHIVAAGFVIQERARLQVASVTDQNERQKIDSKINAFSARLLPLEAELARSPARFAELLIDEDTKLKTILVFQTNGNKVILDIQIALITLVSSFSSRSALDFMESTDNLSDALDKRASKVRADTAIRSTTLLGRMAEDRVKKIEENAAQVAALQSQLENLEQENTQKIENARISLQDIIKTNFVSR